MLSGDVFVTSGRLWKLLMSVQCQEAIANLNLMTSDDFIIYKVRSMHMSDFEPHTCSTRPSPSAP